MDKDYTIIKQFLGAVLLDGKNTTIKPEKNQQLYLAEKDGTEYFIITDENRITIKTWCIGGIQYAGINI